MILFKSMYNEMYVKDISNKIRASLNIKKKNGEFVGAEGKSLHEFIMPISISGSWNYRFSDKFYGGFANFRKPEGANLGSHTNRNTDVEVN